MSGRGETRMFRWRLERLTSPAHMHAAQIVFMLACCVSVLADPHAGSHVHA